MFALTRRLRKALHGKQSDRNSIDEGWAFTEAEGALILGAIERHPTHPPAVPKHGCGLRWRHRQFHWLARSVARGRDGDPSICYVEWSIPDDRNVGDIERPWFNFHPAYGYTVTVDCWQNSDIPQ